MIVNVNKELEQVIFGLLFIGIVGGAMEIEFKEAQIKKHLLDKLRYATKCYVAQVDDGVIQVFVSPPVYEKGVQKEKWYISIAHLKMMLDPTGKNFPGRIITWQEACFIKSQFIPPDTVMGILLPPNDDLDKFNTQWHLVEI